jgi:hypothetical protein
MSWSRVCGRGSGLKALSPLASRRSTAALTEVISLGSTPGRASWNYRVQTGGPSPAPVQRAPRGPVLMPAGSMPEAARVRGYEARPRGPLSLPFSGSSLETPFTREIRLCNWNGDRNQVTVSGLRTKSFRCGNTRFIEPSCPALCRASRLGGHGCAKSPRAQLDEPQ